MEKKRPPAKYPSLVTRQVAFVDRLVNASRGLPENVAP